MASSGGGAGWRSWVDRPGCRAPGQIGRDGKVRKGGERDDVPRKGKGFRDGRQREGELGEGGVHGIAVGEERSGRRDGWMG